MRTTEADPAILRDLLGWFTRGQDYWRASAERPQRDAFLPFGAGAHACIGQQLSTLEAKLLWHSLLRKARFRLARPYRARHQLTPLGAVSGKVQLALEPISR